MYYNNKGYIRLALFINSINDYQMQFHQFLMKKFNTHKDLDLTKYL